MRRLASAAALGAVMLLAVPVTPASACSVPAPFLLLDPERVARGARVKVSGEVVAHQDGTVPPCDPPIVPIPPEPSEEPSETPSPSPSPLISLPPLRKVAYSEPLPPLNPVTITIEERREWPAKPAKPRTIGVVHAGYRERNQDGMYSFWFVGTVTIPRDLVPGRYVLNAFERGGVYYGAADVTVTNALAATGPDARLAALALLLLGGTVVLVRQQQAHRLGAGRHAVTEGPAHR